jgi:hypothetical protein
MKIIDNRFVGINVCHWGELMMEKVCLNGMNIRTLERRTLFRRNAHEEIDLVGKKSELNGCDAKSEKMNRE